MALSMPSSSSRTFIIGAIQLVVQEALEIISSPASTTSSFTPSTTVLAPSPLAGAEITTFFAPALMCARASSGLVKNPVLSITTSTPKSIHGNFAGSFSANTGISRELITSEFSFADTFLSYAP